MTDTKLVVKEVGTERTLQEVNFSKIDPSSNGVSITVMLHLDKINVASSICIYLSLGAHWKTSA